MARPRPRTVVLRLCAALTALAGALLVLAAGPGPAAADTPWGTSGASYRSGVICTLPDGRRVALASWAVDRTTAFSVADVVARGASYGPAPRSGALGILAAGSRGITGTDLAALAYLVAHPGTGSAVQVAETSALVARSFGGGAAQLACLGRQGTSAAGAAALAAAAHRFAGPYTVQPDAVQAKPGSNAPVSATVRSAAGAPTPGLAVTFSLNGITATATTGADGRARARLTVPSTAAVLSAAVSEPAGLRLIRSRPESVTAGAPTTVTAHSTFTPVLHPTPRLALGGGSALVLAGGALTPSVTVTGTYGYAGAGSVTVVGPVRAPGTASCSDVAYAGAPAVWTGSFSFVGDGPRTVGRTGALAPGCYAFTGTLSTVDSDPAVTVSVAAEPASAVGVSALQLTQSVGSGLARTGPLAATVTASSATGASVSSTLTAYGPLPPVGGRCDTGTTWTGAHVVSRSAAVTLTPQGGDRLAATVRTAAVTATGCYALVASSTVTQGGRSAAVTVAPGAAGTTVTVLAPTVGVTNSAYDGRQGVPMTGTVHVTGTSGLAARVAIGLVSAPAPVTGCHGLTFTAATGSAAASTTVETTGDGDYPFRSPVPRRNRCYGVTATLAMAADPAVRVGTPFPDDGAVFLAGAVVHAPADIEVHAAAATRPTRELAVLAVAAGVTLAVALALMIAAAVAGERRPDPRAADRLVEIIEWPREPAVT